MLSGLETERLNRESTDLDQMSALEIATLMNREDAKVLRAVRRALPAIAKAIDVVRDRLAPGGRLIYVGTAPAEESAHWTPPSVRPPSASILP